MSPALAAPILITMTLLVSGLAKLGSRRVTVDAMTSLRLPARGLHPLVATVLPGAEVALALLLWAPVPVLQTVIAVLVAALMVAYLVIIARALRFEEAVECACFGTLASPTVSRATLLRNALLTLAALLTVVLAATGEVADAVVHTPGALLGWTLALGATALLTTAALGGLTAPDAPPAATAAVPDGDGHAGDAEGSELDRGTEEAEELDYERRAIPAAVLQREDGTLVTLRELTEARAALLLFVTEGCGPCERVMDQVGGWAAELEPTVQVLAVLRTPAAGLRERTTARVAGRALHDPRFSARETLGGRGAPSAALLGADGMLAGGPVVGGDEVIGFAAEIAQQIREARAQGALPAAERAAH